MQGSEFLYFLLDEFNRFYSMENGELKVSNAATPLQFSPDGWGEVSIKNKRNKKYFGIDRTITIPYSFVEDGAGILKNIYYRFGDESKVYLVICQQQLFYDGTEYGFWYKQLMKGDVDLSTFNHVGEKVTVTILEDGLPKYLKANENTVYEIPLDDEAVNVKLDGINLRGKFNYLLLDQRYGLIGDTAPAVFTNAYIGIVHTYDEGNSVGLLSNTIYGEIVNSINYNSSKYFFKAVKGTTVTVNMKIKIDVDIAAGSPTLKVLLDSSLDGVNAFNQRFTLINQTISTSIYEFTFSQTVTLLDGEELYLYTNVTSGYADFYFRETELTVDFTSINETTYIKALRPFTLFERLIEKVTDGNFQVDSTLLNNEYFRTKVISSGDGIRGLSNSVIKTSLSDFFQFTDLNDTGLTLSNGKVIIERKKDLVIDTDITDLGEVSRLKCVPATDLKFNQIKIGYPNKDQEGVNGREAFNNTFEFTLGALRVSKTLDKTTKYIGDCYSVELTRLDFNGKDTTDSRQDNDVYILDIEDTLREADGDIPAHYRLDRSLNATLTGLLEPETVYNVGITPKRLFYNNGSYIRSVLHKLDSRYIKFTTSSKNSNVTTTDPEVIEKADVLVSSLDSPYFKPYYLEFELIGQTNILELLDVNPLKIFRFTFKGNTYKGIAEEVGVEPNYNVNQTYKLLCTHDTDLTPLIDYYG